MLHNRPVPGGSLKCGGRVYVNGGVSPNIPRYVARAKSARWIDECVPSHNVYEPLNMLASPSRCRHSCSTHGGVSIAAPIWSEISVAY